MCDCLRERWKMRSLVRVEIHETEKHAGIIDVRDFLSSFNAQPLIPIFSVNPSDYLNWVRNNITFVPEDSNDYWKFPEETLKDGFGDCEDGAILLANMLLQAGFPYWKVLVSIYETPQFHVVVVYDTQLLDWVNPKLKEIPSTWRLWYCFNRKNAYTTKEHVKEWKK